MAWLGTFARWFVVPGVDGGLVKDYGVLIKAHIDFVLMSLYCLAIYAAAKAVGAEIPVLACWLIAIGGLVLDVLVYGNGVSKLHVLSGFVKEHG